MTLIDAVPKLRSEFPNIRVIIVGDGELRPELEAQAERLGIQDVVVFTGFRNDVAELLELFDVFVMPSTMEGLGTSILDALAARKPVVATRTGGIPEIIEDGRTGYLVQPKDAAALADAIARLIHEPAKAARFAEAGRRIIEERFSVSRMVEATENAYYNLLSRHRKGSKPATEYVSLK
jgi:glycosyltransferase involved in cell wall biosynthesis